MLLKIKGYHISSEMLGKAIDESGLDQYMIVFLRLVCLEL